MPYIVSGQGVQITATVGTYPAYQTAAGSTTVTPAAVGGNQSTYIITVAGWTLDKAATLAILDVDAYVWLSVSEEIARITGFLWETTSTPGIYKLTINIDKDPSGETGTPAFTYIPLQDALQQWNVKVDNIGAANIVVNDTIPISAGDSSVWGKAKQVRPLKIDASDSSAVASNAVF